MNSIRSLRSTLIVAFVLLIASGALAQQRTLISINAAGTHSGNADSGQPVVSADGRFVAFVSGASDLTSVSDTNGAPDVFVRDRQTGITVLVSINSAGTGSGNGPSGEPSISADGRFVAFSSLATDLSAIGGGGVFVRDLQNGITRMVSVNNTGTATGNNSSGQPFISANGSVVVFSSLASNLTNINDTNNQQDIFARNLQTNTTKMVSVNITFDNGGNDRSEFPSARVISDDGRFVVFNSAAGNLVANDTNGSGIFNTDVFVRDLQTDQISLVTINSDGTGSGNFGTAISSAQISGNGRFVAFHSSATNLVAGLSEANSGTDVFVRDLVANTTRLVSLNQAGTATGNGDSSNPAISADGRFIAFISNANNLGPNDNNAFTDVYVRDMQLGLTTLVTVNSSGDGSGNSGSGIAFGPLMISADGRFVLFTSSAGNLAFASDTNSSPDLYLRDLQAQTTTLITINSNNLASGLQPSYRYALTANNSTVFVPYTTASSLTLVDDNFLADVYLYSASIPAPFTISGTVTNANGNGLAGVTITLSGSQSGTATTGSNGSYSFGNLTQGGNYTLTPSLGGHAFTPASSTFNNLGQNQTANFIGTPTSTPSRVQFAQVSYSVSENVGFLNILVTRTDVTAAATVKYSTSDATDVNFRCDPATAGQPTGIASRKCDYHIAAGTLRFAAGEAIKQFTLSIVDDSYVEAAESFTITLSNPVGMTLGQNSSVPVTINDNDVAGQANPINQTPFFVRQLYVDLLSREPDASGAGWVSRIDLCGQPGQAPPPCDRVTVAGDGFLGSTEFFDRQFFVIRLYRTGLGRIPVYSEVGDLASVSGFLTAAELELNKQDLVKELMARPEFTNSYNGLNNAQFVDKLIQTAGVTIPAAARDGLVNALDTNTKTRAQVFREISERPEVVAKYLHEAQVASAYYGFFSRNPDGAYLDFLRRLDSGEITLGDLANAFVNAAEYRQRFGQ